MEFASDASFVERGRAAFAARAWADAYEALSKADRQTPLGADDLQRFALSAALLARDEQMLALLEREHDLRVADGELERAALCAFWIGFRSLFLGEAGRSNGWLERSAKLTGELGRPSVAEGFLLLPLALRNAAAGKLDDAVHVAERSVELAGRFGNLDLEALAQSVLGRVLVRQGQIERGLAQLDLSMVTASRDSVTPTVTGVVYCAAISNCARIFALDRAREWTRALSRFCAAQPQLITFSGTCLVHCSEVHQASGDWQEAEREAELACEHVPAYVPVHAGPLRDALYQRAELKRLLGEFEAAEALYRESSEKGRDPQPGLSYRLETNRGEYRVPQVVVAMSSYQRSKLPAWARELSPELVQLHGSEYRSPAQLRPGAVLMVGAGNTGAEIGIELARQGHAVFLSGRDTGHVPFEMDGFWARVLLCRLVLRGVFHYLLTIRTPLGRKARPKMISQGGPLIRQKPGELLRAGVERAPRTTGVENGRPKLEDGRVLPIANVIFSTGFESGLDFIELPIFDEGGEPRHDAGVVKEAPGLYFVGQHFLYSYSSTMIHGVGRDAERIARHAAANRNRETPAVSLGLSA